MTIIELREPLKSFIGQLDKYNVSVNRDGTRIEICGHWVYGLPDLDQEDARALAAELHAATAPVIKKFRDRKLKEVLGANAGPGQSLL